MTEDGGQETGGTGQGPGVDNRVIPVMREAVETVRLVLFKELKPWLAARHSDWSSRDIGRLAAAVVNDLYGTPNREGDMVDFTRRHRDLVEQDLYALAEGLPALCPLLTDSLRMQCICDEQEGVNSIPTLLRAREFGILQEDRVMPMPSTFMIAVRRLGAEHGILESAMDPEEMAAASGETGGHPPGERG